MVGGQWSPPVLPKYVVEKSCPRSSVIWIVIWIAIWCGRIKTGHFTLAFHIGSVNIRVLGRKVPFASHHAVKL